MAEAPIRVLCVVSEAELQHRLATLLAVPPCAATVRGNLGAACELLVTQPWDAVLCACWLPEAAGQAAVDRLRSQAAEIPVILLARAEDEEAAAETLGRGAQAYVVVDELSSRMLARVLRAARRQRLAECRARELQQQFANAFHLSRVATAIALADGTIEQVNQAFCQLLGLGASELQGMPLASLLPPEDAARAAAFVAAAIVGGEPTMAAEVALCGKAAPPLWGELSLSLMPPAQDGPSRFFIRIVDCTRRKQSEAALLHSEQRYRALAENSADANVLLAPDGTILDAGPSTQHVTGYAPPEIIGRNAFSLIHRDDLPAWEAFFGRVLRHPREIFAAGMRIYHRKRGWCYMEGTARNLLDEPAVAAIVLNYRDIGERRRADEALRQSEQQYRLLFEHNPQPMLIYEPDGLRFLAVNDAALRLYGFGREELQTMTLYEFFLPEDRTKLAHAHPSYYRGFHHWGAWRQAKRDGTQMDVEITSCAYRFGGRSAHLALITEVTEQKRLEEQSRQAQKMEAIGRLAGGIAHDFNNLLTVICGYSDLILSQLEPGSQLQQRVGEIQKAAGRASSLTRHLLAFSRQQVLQPKVLNLNDTVQGMATMLRRLIGEDVELNMSLAHDLGRVAADPSQLEQVVMNLAVNARDAMPAGGKLHFSTQNVELDNTYAEMHPHVAPGAYVLLAVSDTGCGMDAGTQAHIFEPFFSTKGNKGTGLGLSTVYGIVKQSNGYIWVYSEIGLGTTFKIYLPCFDQTPPPEAAAIPAPVRASGAILLVENNLDLRRLTAEILVNAGYEVLAAANGAEALEIYRREGERLRLVMTDVVMPGLGGQELGNQLQADRPPLPILYMSGYGSEDALRRGLVSSQQRFLQKPFTTQTLLGQVRSAIAGN